MNNDALVSIPLCTYNGARYLSTQIDSLLAQSYQNFEIVAVDDASSDTTVEILNDYARRDARIKVVVNPINLGFKLNFANALQQCVGEYIAPCDQDDIWLPDKLAALLEHVGAQALASLVYCDSELIDDAGTTLNVCVSDKLSMLSSRDPAQFAFANCVSGHAMLFKRELLLHALPIPDGLFHDWWLTAVAAAHGGVAYCARSLVRYRQHAANVTDMLEQRQRRAPGYRLRDLRETGQRLAHLAELPGPHQALLIKLTKLWRAREHQWLSPALTYCLARHGHVFYACLKRSRLQLLRMSLKFFLGLRFKRLTNKYSYLL